MVNRIKNKIDSELCRFVANIEKTYALRTISPLLFKNIQEFVLRDGKRIRPILFVVGYLGYTNKPASGYYRSAVALEFLHDFLLIHDDIIDKSPSRRGKPTMHILLDKFLKKHPNAKFNGQDLSIVVGDVMYALAIDAFLSIKEEPLRKERALRNFVKAALLTGTGEFIELLGGIKKLSSVNKKYVYKVYDYKTAHYTFACPLSTGAMLAGAPENQIKKLHEFGMHLGRAFQIKDDILGVFGDEKEIGKSTSSDLQEAKKTLLIWYAYQHTTPKRRKIIEKIFSKNILTHTNVTLMREIITDSGALNFAKKEIRHLREKANAIIQTSRIQTQHKEFLARYAHETLTI